MVAGVNVPRGPLDVSHGEPPSLARKRSGRVRMKTELEAAEALFPIAR